MDQPSAVTRVEELTERLQMELVYFLELNATRSSGEDMSSHSLTLETKYHRGETRLDYLFDARCVVHAADDSDIATISVSLVASYSFDGDAEGLASELVEEFGSRVATFAAYPYLREAVQNLASRLLLPGLTLAMLKRGEQPPFTQL